MGENAKIEIFLLFFQVEWVLEKKVKIEVFAVDVGCGWSWAI